MMPLKLSFDLVQEDTNRFVGWLNEVKGIVAQGESEQEVRDELIKLLRIKWDYERTHKKTPENVNTRREELTLQIA